jgi:hypothetical protein
MSCCVRAAKVYAQFDMLWNRFQVLVERDATTRAGSMPAGQESIPVLWMLKTENLAPMPPCDGSECSVSVNFIAMGLPVVVS